MAYSIDLRERVVAFVQEGGTKIAASHQFKISLWCVKDWCKRDDLTPGKTTGRARKFSWEELKENIREAPDMLLRERAAQFGVHINAIWYACQQMGITYKKNT
jgi:transposase